MAIALAICGPEGAVLARATEPDASRCFELGPRALGVAMGRLDVVSAIHDACRDNQVSLESSPFVLGEIMQAIRTSYYKQFVETVPWNADESPATVLLGCGVNEFGRPWIIDVDRDALMTEYTSQGFAAASVHTLPAELMQRFLAEKMGDFPLASLSTLALRAMLAFLDSVTWSSAVDIWQLTEHGVRKLRRRDVNALAALVEGSRRADTEAFTRLITQHHDFNGLGWR